MLWTGWRAWRVVDGLSAEEVAAHLDAELAEETVGYSMSVEEAAAGLDGLPGVGVHGAGRALILEEP